MHPLAWKNLFHDKTRLAVTLTGIVFALVLIVVQFGLFLNFLDTSANVVEHANADLWITAPKIPHVNGGAVIPESRRYQVLAVPGVAKAVKQNIQFVNWKLPGGATESAQIVGFDLDGGMGGPWNLVAGDISELRREDTVIIDELYKKKLGVQQLGDTVEINGRRAQVVGFTTGIRSFTTAPYIYTSFKNSQNYVGRALMAADETLYVLVRLEPGADRATIKAALQKALPGNDVYTNEEIHKKTQFYWVFGTGAGVTTLMGAILGLLVGVVVVAQTIYSATVDHIREFGTLKAMGASNAYIYNVIIQQAVLAAVMGYALAMSVSYFVVKGAEKGQAPISLPPPVAAGIFAISVGMCVAASVLSIRKATQIDPALVFKA